MPSDPEASDSYFACLGHTTEQHKLATARSWTLHVFAWIPLQPPRYGQDESSDFAAEVGRGSPICSIDGSLPSISWPITVAAEAAPVLWHVERSMPAAKPVERADDHGSSALLP